MTNFILSEETCRKWCEKNNCTLVKMGRLGFYYMTPIGEDWYIPFDDEYVIDFIKKEELA